MDSPLQARDDSLAAALSPDKHGSEEWGRSPTQELASPSLGAEVRASHTKPPMAAPDQGPPQEGNLEPTPPEYSDPRSWSTPDVVNWLEDLRWVPAKAIDLVTELGADGQFLNTLIDSSDCSTVLENDFGIKQVTHRLLFVSKLRGLHQTAAKAAAKLPSQAANLIPQGHTGGLAGSINTPLAERTPLAGEKNPLCDANQTTMELLDAPGVSTLKSQQTDFASDANYEPPQNTCGSAMPKSRSEVAKQSDNFASLSGRVSANKVVQQDDCHFKWKWYLTDG